MRYGRLSPTRLWLVLVILAGSGSLQAQSLQTEQDRFDFGEVIEGTEPSHVFRISNATGEQVGITGVDADCGCTVPEWTDDLIPSGAKADLSVVFNSRSRLGPFVKAIRIGTTVGDTLTLWLEGEVVPVPFDDVAATTLGSFLVDSDEYDFRSFDHGEELVHVFRLKNAGSDPIQISNARKMDKSMRLSWNSRPIFPSDVVEFEVRIDTGKLSQTEPFSVSAILFTDDSSRPAKTFRLRGTPTSKGR